MASTFTPTPEQEQAIAAARTGENLVITACAGSGKTSTLRLIADALAPARGIYVAYNKAIQTDAAKSFPSNVTCRTAHSLAFRAMPEHGKRAVRSQRMSGRQLAYALDIEHGFALGNDRELAPGRIASLVMETISRWCHSADQRITTKHTPMVEGAEEVSHELASFLAERAQRAWDTDLRFPQGSLPFTHDMYVKAWALTNPRIPAAFILYDEAQDADPCIAGVILAQEGVQLIAVGDESQAIYGWRGATDAMRNWPAQHRVALTKSFRFGPAVAAEANVFLGILNAPLRVEGHEPIASVVGGEFAPDAILCRTNAEMVSQALNLPGRRTYAIVGGTQAIQKFSEAAEALMNGRRAAWHPDLGAFKTWGDVVHYVTSEGGSDLGAMVRLVESYGIEVLAEVCANARPEGKADVTISTAHKAKGREWERVLIAPDFAPSEERQAEGLSRSEAMLAYVAVTRAKLALNCDALSWAKGDI